jgi:ATP-dependent Clp protease adapter protein ClpS
MGNGLPQHRQHVVRSRRPRRLAKALPQFSISIVNDDKIRCGLLRAAIVEILHFSDARAEAIAESAHFFGESTLTVTHLEHAELISTQFKSKGLRVSIKPAD